MCRSSSVQRPQPNHGGRFNAQPNSDNGTQSIQRMPKSIQKCLQSDDIVKELVKSLVKRLIYDDLTFSDWIQTIIQTNRHKSIPTDSQKDMPTLENIRDGGGKDTGHGNPKDSDSDGPAGKTASMGAWGGGSGVSLFKGGDKGKACAPKNPYKTSGKAWGSVRPDSSSKVTKSASKSATKKSVISTTSEKIVKSASRQHFKKKTKGNDGSGQGLSTFSAPDDEVKVLKTTITGTDRSPTGMSTPARSTTTGTAVNATPVKAGSKRSADKSPQVTPNGKVHPQDDPTFPTRDLQAKLNSVANKDSLSPEEVRAIVEDNEYAGQLWWQDDIFEAISSEIQSKKGSIFPDISPLDYVFSGDEQTSKILPSLNYFVVTDKLLKLCAKNKEAEKLPKAHPVNGPFSLIEDRTTQTIYVLNVDEVEILSVKRFDVEHYLADYAFVMEDRLTYFTMCWKSHEIINAMNELFLYGNGRWRSMGETANGPFSIVEGGTQGKRYLQSRTGDVLCIEPALQGKWDDIKHQYGIGDTAKCKVRSFRDDENKYDALSDEEESKEEEYGEDDPSESESDESKSTSSSEHSSTNSEDESYSSGGKSESSATQSSEGRPTLSNQLPKKKTKANSKSKRSKTRTTRSKRSNSKASYKEDSTDSSSSKSEEPSTLKPVSGKSVPPKSKKGQPKKSIPSQDTSETPSVPLKNMVVSIREESLPPPSNDIQSDEDDDGTNLNNTLLEDVSPTTPSLSQDGMSALSPESKSSLSEILDPNEGVMILDYRMSVVAGVDNADRIVSGNKSILSTSHVLDRSAKIVPRFDPTGKGLPHIKSADDPNFFSSNTISMLSYNQLNNAHALKQRVLTEKEIKAQLKRDQVDISKLSAKKQRQKAKKLAKTGPRHQLTLYGSVAIKTNIKHTMWERVVESLDLELSRREQISVSLKPMQCWDSASKQVLIGVQNNFCPEGVASTLKFHCEEVEKKYLVSSGKPLDFFDKELHPLNVTVRKLRELEVPDEERSQLTFDTFPDYAQFVFHIETSEEGWMRYEPLFDILSRSGKLQLLFGDKAHLMAVSRRRKANIGFTRKFQGKGRISMAYQIASTVLECGSVSTYDHEVKVRMAEKPILDADGNHTGEVYIPQRPYSRTTLRKELSKIEVDGVKVFQGCVMTMLPPEQGQSKIAVPYDPTNEAYKRIFSWASATVATLPSFCYCWFTHVCGYNEATVKRLLNSFYLNHQVTAHECTWNPENYSVTTTHSTYADTYLEDNADMDHGAHNTNSAKVSFASAEHRAQLLDRLNYKPGQTCDDVRSGASAVTGEDGTSAASSIRSETSMGAALGRTTSIKMDLARANRALAEKDIEFKKMQTQLAALMAARGMDSGMESSMVEPPELKKSSSRVVFEDEVGDQEMTDAAETVENMESGLVSTGGAVAGSQGP